MKKYIGKKEVMAEPMMKGEAYKLGLLQSRCDATSENDTTDGYKVRYENGYESWSPKDVFERSYKSSDTFRDRMKMEFNELYERFVKLKDFIGTEKFNSLNDVDKGLMKMQKEFMEEYISVLLQRIQRADDDEGNKPIIIEASFGLVVEAIKCWFCATREDWKGSKFICKQIPCTIEKDVIPGMQSLPKTAKYHIVNNRGMIDYNNQVLEYDDISGKANSYVPTMEDIFANDWKIILL